MIVLDSSVALKWIFDNEEGSVHARRMRDEHISGVSEIAVPALFFYEVANVLATKIRLDPDEVQEAFTLISDFELNMHELDNADFADAIALSMSCKVSVYDACYLVLAERLGCRFLTADRKLWDKVKRQGIAELLKM